MPATGTLCPFPLATPNGDPPRSPADCNTTFAQLNQPLYDIVDGLLGVVGGLTLAITLHRLWALNRLARHQHKYLREMVTFEFFCFAAIFSLAVSLESLDLFGMRGWIVPDFYFVIDELCAGSAICMGVWMVDFWRRLEHGIGKVGLDPKLKYSMIVVSMINFPFWEIIGVSVPSIYLICEGIKGIIGSMLTTVLMFWSFSSIRALLRILKLSSGSSGSGKNDSAAQTRSKMSRKAATVLVRKYTMYAVVVVVACAAFLTDAIISLSASDYSWVSVPTDGSDPVQVVFKFVYLVICACVYYFFSVPRPGTAKGAVSSSSHDNTAGTGPKGSVFAKNNSSLVPASVKDFSVVASASVADDGPLTLPISPTNETRPNSKGRVSDRTILKKDILAEDGPMHDKFVDFVKSKYASESLDCLIAIKHFKAIDNQAQRDEAGRDVVARFIRPHAAETVTTPDGIRRGLESLTTFAPDSFALVETLCFNVLKDNFLAEFLDEVGHSA